MAKKTLAELKSGRDFTDVLESFPNFKDTGELAKNFSNAQTISAATLTLGAAHYQAPLVFTANCVVTLPAVALGITGWFVCGADGVQITVSPASGDKWLIAIDGSASADNKDIILTSATAKSGDYCKIAYSSADGWQILEAAGTWVDE